MIMLIMIMIMITIMTMIIIITVITFKNKNTNDIKKLKLRLGHTKFFLISDEPVFRTFDLLVLSLRAYDISSNRYPCNMS